MKNRKDDIEKYLRGELSPAEMHALEKEALNDPFLAEALEGFEHAKADDFLHDLHRLNRKVHERTRRRKDKSIALWGWPVGIAATLFLVAVSGFLVIRLVNEQNARQLALQEELSLQQNSTDTLYVIFPAEAIADAREHSRIAPAQEIRRRPSPGTARDTGPAAPPPDAQRRADHGEESQPALPQEVEHEPIALADIPELTEEGEEQSRHAKQKEAGDTFQDKKRDTRIAASEQRQATGAVARSLETDIVLLKGKVTAASDGEGLPGVNVTVKGTNVGTVTDANGEYELPVPADGSTLVFSFIGFQSHEVAVKSKEALDIALEEDTAALSEVVVISGYGSANDRSNAATFTPAAPEGRKSDYKEYLAGAIVYPQQAVENNVEGRVTVRFTVQPDGRLTDFGIVKGIGHGCDEELIRAIRTGPSWEPATRGAEKISDKVKVRYRFELPK